MQIAVLNHPPLMIFGIIPGDLNNSTQLIV